MTPHIDTSLQDARDALRRARRNVAHEIGSYPTPISGCDAQFNHLLALRSQIGRALDALETAVFVPTPRRPDLSSRVESR
ncbi:MAG: hypothetical protein AAF366_01210 [Pseudomonadota bacterium]